MKVRSRRYRLGTPTQVAMGATLTGLLMVNTNSYRRPAAFDGRPWTVPVARQDAADADVFEAFSPPRTTKPKAALR
ncbi:MAG: hypothetical protein ACO1SV_26900 [Fimbriimonas sp.]